jgi:mono/diheme cytochrome c family protein
MRRSMLVAATCAISFGVLAGQNSSYRQDAGWRAPAEAVSRPNPLTSRPEAAAGGEKLFRRNCVECHGEDGSGLAKKNAADLLLPEVQSQSDGTLFWKITNGNTDRGMPSFSRLPELQRWQLVLFMRNLKSAGNQHSKDAGK